MNTKDIFLDCKYDSKIQKSNIAKYFKVHVGFNVLPENIEYFKEEIEGIDYYIVVLKDDIRRVSKSTGGSGVLRQKQWSIFIFNFIKSSVYENFFGKNISKKSIRSPYNQENFDTFEYQDSKVKYTGKYPERLHKSSYIFYLLHHYVYSKLRKNYR